MNMNTPPPLTIMNMNSRPPLTIMSMNRRGRGLLMNMIDEFYSIQKQPWCAQRLSTAAVDRVVASIATELN